MRVLFLLGFAAVLLSSCLCNEDENKRKYVQKEEGYRRQVDRLEEILSLGIFSTRQAIPLQDILDLVTLILDILDALDGLLPTEPTTTNTGSTDLLPTEPTTTNTGSTDTTTLPPVDSTTTGTTLCKRK